MYAKGILDEYGIGRESRGSLLTYDSSPKIVVDIDAKANGKDIKVILDSLQYNTNNKPNLEAVFKTISQQLDERKNSVQRNMPVNVVVLTTGNYKKLMSLLNISHILVQ